MRSTAIVLWLMILLVFVPIGAAHAIALFLERSNHPDVASVVGKAETGQVVTR